MINPKAIIIAVLIILSGIAIYEYLDKDGDSGSNDYTKYGSSEVGSVLVTFDANGGSGTYGQWVKSGNDVGIYLPTSKTITAPSGKILIGWNTSLSNANNGQVQYLCGDHISNVSVNTVYYAVYSDTVYKIGANDMTSTMRVDRIALGSSYTYNVSDIFTDETAGLFLAYSTYTPTASFSVSNGKTSTTPVSTDRNTYNVQADWMVINKTSTKSITFSGTPDHIGTFILTMKMVLGQGTYYFKLAVEVYDANTDPSNIYHVTYNGVNANDSCVGMIGTACKLPESKVNNQKGWKVNTLGYESTYAIGSGYTIVKSVPLTAVQYTADEVISTGLVGVLAYNVDGGTTSQPIAYVVPTDGYSAIANVTPTKEGYKFIGWTDESGKIYTKGYQYNLNGKGYTELKAVWSNTAGTPHNLVFADPTNSEIRLTVSAYNGYNYATPVYGFDKTGYNFIGWSTTKANVGNKPTDTINAGQNISGITTTVTFYAVYQPNTYTFTINYHLSDTSGVWKTDTATSPTVPYTMTLISCSETNGDKVFNGWSNTAYESSGNYNAGDGITFDRSATIDLFVAWADKGQGGNGGESDLVLNTFTLAYYGNSIDATNIPSRQIEQSYQNDYTFIISGIIPVRSGYNFLGWDSTGDGVVDHYPHESITLTVPTNSNGDVIVHSVTNVLYAIYEQYQGGTGEGGDPTNQHFVTFKIGNSTIKTVRVNDGATVNEPSRMEYNLSDGKALVGWKLTNGNVWSFDTPVTEDITLIANTLNVFTVSADGNTVTVTIKVNSTHTTVEFSDGHKDTVVGKTYTYEVEGYEGKTLGVNVTATTLDGVLNAYNSIQIDSKNNGGDENNTQTIDLKTPVILGVAIAGILAGFVAVRRFI